MATEKVCEFLLKNNRPFSARDVVQGLGEQSVSKNQVQKSLDQLVAEKKVFEKVYGKQKVYCIAQDSSLLSEITLQDIFKVNQQSTELTGKLDEIQKELQSVSSELHFLNVGSTLEDLTAMKNTLEGELELLEKKLESCNAHNYRKNEAERITEAYKKTVGEYNYRKTLCEEMVLDIYDHYPKSKKELMESLDLETDEDVGFVMKKIS